MGWAHHGRTSDCFMCRLKLPHCESPMWWSAVVLEDDGVQYPILSQLREYKLLEHVYGLLF
jgi:hypothetical protein